MQKVFKKILDIFLTVFISVISTALIASVASWISAGSWTKWLEQISGWVWALFIILFIGLFIIVLIRKRIRGIRESESRRGLYTPVISSPWGYREVEEIRHVEVIWKILAPNPSPVQSAISYEKALTSIDPKSIEIDVPPRCPHCKTELEEKQRFLGGYKWICVGCDFSKNNKDRFYKEADRAKRRAEASLEKRFRIASEEDH